MRPFNRKVATPPNLCVCTLSMNNLFDSFEQRRIRLSSRYYCKSKHSARNASSSSVDLRHLVQAAGHVPPCIPLIPIETLGSWLLLQSELVFSCLIVVWRNSKSTSG